MKEYIIRRLGQLVITYFAFMTILFVVFRQLPGDPTTQYLQDGIHPAAREEAIERFGLDQPIYIQYMDYLTDLIRFDWGTSYQSGEPVTSIVFISFWNTIFLMGITFFVAYLIGIIIGGFFGWNRGGRFERIGIIATLLSRSSPEFLTGIVLLMIFPFGLGILPAGGMRTPGAEIATFWGRYFSFDFIYHMILPALTGVIFYFGTPALLMRSSMINILDDDFIEIKKAEGIPDTTILFKHAVRNSMLPMTTLIAVIIGIALGGSIVIETVFSWPGMGRAMVRATIRNDYPVAQATFFLMGSVIIFMNFVADVAYVYLDPRVKYD